MSILTINFDLAYYDEIMILWKTHPGIGLSGADTRENIGSYLARNPGGSFLALVDGKVAGTVLGGHDGRRGFLYHLFVAEEHRGRGLGRVLLDRAVECLEREGIQKCHVMVFASNEEGKAFWRKAGFHPRGDLEIFSFNLPG